MRCEVSYPVDRFAHVSTGLMDIMKLTLGQQRRAGKGLGIRLLLDKLYLSALLEVSFVFFGWLLEII